MAAYRSGSRVPGVHFILALGLVVIGSAMLLASDLMILASVPTANALSLGCLAATNHLSCTSYLYM
jgi:hypothetical protein